MSQRFDLIVIGTGSAGASAAHGVRKAGQTVAIIDRLPFGGTCALRGCDPKKVLVGVAELADWADRMKGHGIAGDMRIDWHDLMRFKRSFTDPVPADREEGFRAAGIATYHGSARFLSATTIAVGSDVLEAAHVVVATGAKPAPLNVQGEEHLITSDRFLELDELPKRIAFVGGGYIAFEFAHISARVGAMSTILQRGSRVLTGFEPDLVDDLVEVTRKIGIDVRMATEVRGIEATGSAFRVHLHSQDGDSTVDCDLAVHAAGRVADIDDLDLKAAGVSRTHKGIAVDQHLQSVSNPAVYAAGDSADGGGLPLTPVAGAEGDLIARNLLEGNRRTVDLSGLASIVYTIPALGMTGLTQAQAHERGIAFTSYDGDSTDWYSSRRVAAWRSAYRTLVEDGTGHVVGAHVLGPHAEELINVFSLVIRERIPAKNLRDVLFAYPTASSDIAYTIG